MIPMLDSSPTKILEWREKYGIEILQLASPLTRNRHHPAINFGYDCGAYTMHPLSNPNWIPEEKQKMYICKWVVLPDVVGGDGVWHHGVVHGHSYLLGLCDP